MRLYAISCVENYENYGIEEIDEDLLKEYKGTNRLLEKWPANIEIEKYSNGKKADIAYFWTTSDIILLQSAYEKLSDIFCTEEVELLPVKYKGQECFIPHVIKSYELPRLIDNNNKSLYHFPHKAEDVMKAKLDTKYFFKLKYPHVLYTYVFSSVYYTEHFIDLLKDYNIKGIEFDVVWDSEEEM